MLTIIKFWSDWCQPCHVYAKIFEAVSEMLKDVEFQTVNIDDDPESVTFYNVKSIPTTIITKNDKVLDTIVGLVNEEELLNRINKHQEDV